jgi:hypothetical protein
VDLAPVRSATGYCQLNANGQLVVTIANQGSTEATGTVLEVVFYAGRVSVNVPTLRASESMKIPVIIPNGRQCWKPDCFFTIIVDATNNVTEAGGPIQANAEKNNQVSAACVG